MFLLLVSILSLPPCTLEASIKSTPVPFQVQARPMPKGSDFSAILPEQVGNFTRIAYHAPEPDQDGEATYASKKDTVTMFFSLQPSAQDVAEVMRTIQTELRHEKTDKPPRVSLETDPAYLLMVGKTIAFFAWSRGNYIFSADSQGGNSAVLERFMEAFPY